MISTAALPDDARTDSPLATTMSRFFPSATNMIRLDHTHVLSTFHQYKPSAPARVKRGLVNTICTALEIHSQLEEEIFYPAVRAVVDDARIDHSVEEQENMRRIIASLRGMEPEDPAYDETLMTLMRDVIHHVAEDETVVLHAAERHMPDQLGALGARMTSRRIQLVAPRSGEIAMDMGRAASGNMMAMSIAAVAAVGLLWGWRARRGS